MADDLIQIDTPRGILIIDLGTQYAQLIARRVREARVWCEIATPAMALERAKVMDLAGVILSGGPASVYGADAPKVPKELLELGVPVLGICYGMQWMCQQLGGHVEAANEREFGRATIRADNPSGVLDAIDGHTVVWMSHGDQVSKLPAGFSVYASTETCPFAVVGDPARGFYGLQFHPEVTHSVRGREMLENFLVRVCQAPAEWRPDSIVEREMEKVHEIVGDDGEVVMGLSGGVDSSVAAVILHKAIGDRLHCVFVDNGLLRHGERQAVETLFGGHFHMDLTVVDASEEFLAALAGVSDPETKRKIIGKVFIDVFKREAKRFKNAGYLGQGTLYPDVIESVAAHGGNTAVIKSHHNVGGLPKDLDMQLVEPLRERQDAAAGGPWPPAAVSRYFLDLVDAFDRGLDVLLVSEPAGGLVEGAGDASLGAGAVVGEHHDDGVVGDPAGLEVVEESAEVVVGVGDEPGVDLHVAREEAALLGRDR